MRPSVPRPARGSARRRGLAATELALLLPSLSFMGMITIDYARLLHASVEIAAAARDGALYACSSSLAASSGFVSYSAAALADCVDLSPTPTVSKATGTDGTGISYVEVTVSYTFTTIVNYPGIPRTSTITKTIRMAIAPT